ncbi:hypothetical protein [Streptomyces sp. NPDC058657]|uniref:hypothetical protein n=1 Tax=unclassified Streptomyces TaxID=2593676 RepID=UPI003666BFB1
MIIFMDEGGDFVGTAGEQAKPKRGHTARIVLAAGAAVAVLGAALAIWRPWVDGAPFTSYRVSLQDATHTTPGSSPGSCVRTSGSEAETVIYDTDGKRLAAGRAEKEGTLLGAEYGNFADHCMIVTRIDNVPGGLGTYISEWGGGTRTEMKESDLRRPVEDQQEHFKTSKKPKS